MDSAQEVVEVREMRMDIWDSDDPDGRTSPGGENCGSPFAGSDGDDHFIEAGPGLWHNHLGHAARDDQGWFLRWPSLATWLHAVAEAMHHAPTQKHPCDLTRTDLKSRG
ncbi:hypothetical protein [Streptomyces sp. C36]|uniref:hypothetical protein n=1 Tax=Streptomyces sp. C36 TaxID=3237122 RepID=UPI0034C64BDE